MHQRSGWNLFENPIGGTCLLQIDEWLAEPPSRQRLVIAGPVEHRLKFGEATLKQINLGNRSGIYPVEHGQVETDPVSQLNQ